MSSDPAYLSVVEIAAGIRAGRFSARSVVDTHLERIAALDPELRAFFSVASTSASEAAQAIDDAVKLGRDPGVLGGVPYGCKDLIWTRDLPTTAGSRVLEGWIPDKDATVVSRIAAAGGILIGKTSLPEFSFGTSNAPNPWDRRRIAGGSSTGSAIAVACGLAPFALGSDTGGSVRVPAALCGVVGLKPTYGLVSTFGVIPFSWSLDHVGLFARNVADSALILEVVAGYDSSDPASATVPAVTYRKSLSDNVHGLRIGLPRRFFFEHVDPEILEAALAAARSAEQLGAKLVEIDPPDMQEARTVSLVVQMPEALSYHSKHLRTCGDLYGEELRSGLAVGQFILAEQYIAAKRMMTLYRQQMAQIFEQVDLLLTPTCPMIAPQLGAATVTIGGKEEPVGNARTRFTSFFNLTGHPALSMPSGWHTSGLPMGLQLVGRPFEEKTLLRMAHALDNALHQCSFLCGVKAGVLASC